jgi:hypothetical protein
MIQLNPTIPLDTPKGPGYAHFALDYSQEHSVMFLVFINETGEPWIFEQREVRLRPNRTMGVRQ